MEDNYHVGCGGGGGVGPSSNHFSSSIVTSGRDRQDGSLFHLRVIKQDLPWHHHSLIIIHLVFFGSLFSVSDGYGKGGLGPSITHFTSQKVNFWIASIDVAPLQSREHSSMSHSYKYRSYY